MTGSDDGEGGGGELALNPVSYVVLGLVSAMRRATPYEMKQRVAMSIGYFWPFPHSQLYAEPARLAAAGLLAEEVEPGGRRRRHYTLTESGAESLRRWVATAGTESTELRDLALLKLFVARNGSDADVAALAEEQVRAHGERREEYRAIRALVGGVADRWELRTLTLGERWEELCVAFWDEVARDAIRDGSRPPDPGGTRSTP